MSDVAQGHIRRSLTARYEPSITSRVMSRSLSILPRSAHLVPLDPRQSLATVSPEEADDSCRGLHRIPRVHPQRPRAHTQRP